jgi:hypothetical protein
VKILATDQYVRAVQGGTGEAKTAANYAASLYGAEVAKKAGYTQVLWLDGIHHKYLDEVGTMNIMVKIGDEIVTPPLNGTILAGVTRDSILSLMRSWGLKVSERQISIDEVMAAGANGTLDEMWGTGTAAVVSPVGELGYKDRRITINGGRSFMTPSSRSSMARRMTSEAGRRWWRCRATPAYRSTLASRRNASRSGSKANSTGIAERGTEVWSLRPAPQPLANGTLRSAVDVRTALRRSPRHPCSGGRATPS